MQERAELYALLGTARPQRLLFIAATGTTAPAAAKLQEFSGQLQLLSNISSLAGVEAVEPADLAVIRLAASELPAGLIHVLGRLRDQLASRVLVESVPGPLPAAAHRQLVALGYQQLANDSPLWEFDIAHYNPEREWNNPEDWAHPGNFDRFRW